MSVINNSSYQDVAHFHGAPNTGVDALCGEGNSCCPHGDPQFLPWHRLLLANMEELLGEPLPYWDWTEDKDVPDLWEEIRAPLKPPLKSECGADGYGNGYGSKGYGDGYGRGKQ